MSKSIKELEELLGVQIEPGSLLDRSSIPPKSNKQNGLSTRFGGRPVRTIEGKPPTKSLGPIIGSCSLCKRPAKTRFEGIQYCNPHYRHNLQVRKDNIWFKEHEFDPDFDIQAWNDYIATRDSYPIE